MNHAPSATKGVGARGPALVRVDLPVAGLIGAARVPKIGKA
jgi:hypothetical protein